MICGYQSKRLTRAYHPNTKQPEKPMKETYPRFKQVGEPLSPEKLEKAARTLCKMRGIDPDKLSVIQRQDEHGWTAWRGGPVEWKCAADILQARYEEMAALFEAMK